MFQNFLNSQRSDTKNLMDLYRAMSPKQKFGSGNKISLDPYQIQNKNTLKQYENKKDQQMHQEKDKLNKTLFKQIKNKQKISNFVFQNQLQKNFSLFCSPQKNSSALKLSKVSNFLHKTKQQSPVRKTINASNVFHIGSSAKLNQSLAQKNHNFSMSKVFKNSNSVKVRNSQPVQQDKIDPFLSSLDNKQINKELYNSQQNSSINKLSTQITELSCWDSNQIRTKKINVISQEQSLQQIIKNQIQQKIEEYELIQQQYQQQQFQLNPQFLQSVNFNNLSMNIDQQKQSLTDQLIEYKEIDAFYQQQKEAQLESLQDLIELNSIYKEHVTSLIKPLQLAFKKTIQIIECNYLKYQTPVKLSNIKSILKDTQQNSSNLIQAIQIVQDFKKQKPKQKDIKLFAQNLQKDFEAVQNYIQSSATWVSNPKQAQFSSNKEVKNIVQTLEDQQQLIQKLQELINKYLKNFQNLVQNSKVYIETTQNKKRNKKLLNQTELQLKNHCNKSSQEKFPLNNKEQIQNQKNQIQQNKLKNKMLEIQLEIQELVLNLIEKENQSQKPFLKLLQNLSSSNSEQKIFSIEQQDSLKEIFSNQNLIQN